MNKGDTDYLSELSIQYLKSRPKSERSSIGQFLTPRSLREALIDQVKLEPGMRILDPGVGTGEFLRSCLDKQHKLDTVGWDIDHEVLSVAEKLVPEAKLLNLSALEQSWNEDFDLVIGNPPYYEMRDLSKELRYRYQQVIGGRPNIFALFFAAGLGALKPGGVLAFVVPPSMNNGAFFSKLRRFILQNGEIEYLKIFTDTSLFEDVQTAVQLIVIRKGKTGTNYSVNLGRLSESRVERVIFTENPSELESEFDSRSTLWQLGYEAFTGTIVWNQHKDKLRNERVIGSVPLLWAHNISDVNEVILDPNHPKKPQFIISNKKDVGPAIIVNRITGSVGQGNLRCALVPEDFGFLGENHINIIRKRTNVEPLLSWIDILELLRLPGINKRIQLLTGNTQISCTELTHFLPLDSDKKIPKKANNPTLYDELKL